MSNEIFRDIGKLRKLRRKVTKQYTGRCACCGLGLTKKERTIDHIVPISLGGAKHSLSNMQLLCVKCNQKKADKIIVFLGAKVSGWEVIQSKLSYIGKKLLKEPDFLKMVVQNVQE